MVRKLLTIFVLACIPLAPVTAQLLKRPPQFLTTDDISFLKEYEPTLARITSRAAALEKLIAIERGPEVTPRQKILLAGDHGRLLIALGKDDEAKSLAKGIASASPGDPLAQLVAADMLYDANEVTLVVDMVIAATRLQPDVVNLIDPYAFLVLFNQLDDRQLDDASDAFAKRLFEAGWTDGVTNLRSSLAMDVMVRLLDGGSVDEARSYVQYVMRPGDFAKLMTEKRFAVLRQTAIDWAGAHVEKQWPVYLGQVRSDYVQSQTP